MADKKQEPGNGGKSAAASGGSEPRRATGQKMTQNVPGVRVQPTTLGHGPLSATKSSSLVNVSNHQIDNTTDRFVAKSSSPNQQISSDTASQLRSTLALGQLIASNRPTAGSRLIATELRNLSNIVRDESAILRKEIASLSTNLATTLKTAFEEDRDRRGATFRRNAFGHFPFRRFPAAGRGRGGFVPLQFARKSLTSNAFTNTPSSTEPIGNEPTTPATSATAATTTTTTTSTSTSPNHTSPLDLTRRTARKTTPVPSSTIFKHPWLPSDRSSYDGEADTESTDTSPTNTP